MLFLFKQANRIYSKQLCLLALLLVLVWTDHDRLHHIKSETAHRSEKSDCVLCASGNASVSLQNDAFHLADGYLIAKLNAPVTHTTPRDFLWILPFAMRAPPC